MGACNFTAAAAGKDAADAFRAAIERAQYDHGHEGYSGTVAEKHSFKVASVPGVGDGFKLADWIEAAAYISNVRAQAASGFASKEDKAHAKEAERAFNKTIPKKHQAWALGWARAYDDKWGAAICIELTGVFAARWKAENGLKGTRKRVFVFIGMASS